MPHLPRLFFLFVGWLSLGLGIVGIFVPLLPTTPLVLLAAWCFSKGSQRLHQRLLTNPHLGPIIQRWQDEGTIERRVKIRALILVTITFSITLFWVRLGPITTLIIASIGLAVAIFLYRLPEPARR